MSFVHPSVVKQLVTQGGIDQSSLTSSYPPPAGYQEAKDLLRRVARSTMEKDTVVELEENNENQILKTKAHTRLADQFIKSLDCSQCSGKSEKFHSCLPSKNCKEEKSRMFELITDWY